MFYQWKRREGNGATKERLLLAIKAAGFDEQVRRLSQKGVIKTQNSKLGTMTSTQFYDCFHSYLFEGIITVPVVQGSCAL